MPALAPTAYHRRLLATISEQEPGLFRWYASDAYEAERADRLRLDILRSSYRLSPESHERPHRLAGEAAARLGLDLPIVLYQLHQNEAANAGLCFLAGEAHIVLSGPLLAALNDGELLALFGHELAHHLLLTLDGGVYGTAAEVVEASAAHAGASAPFIETALRSRRWTEIFADRGAVIACGGIEPAIACLVKLGTGLLEVSVKDYLSQVAEVAAKLGDAHKRGGDTHPENAVRAMAIDLWHAKGDEAEAEIAELVEGAVALETLDLVQQRDLTRITRAVLDHVLAPAWMRTDVTLAHARAYFPEYTWAPPTELALGAWQLADYFPYVLLDFAVIDPALDEVALAQVLTVAAELGWRTEVVALARKELKMTAGAVSALEQRAPSLLERAAQQETVEPE